MTAAFNNAPCFDDRPTAASYGDRRAGRVRAGLFAGLAALWSVASAAV